MDNKDYNGCTAVATDINGNSRKVRATTDHPDSSYGHYVWVDEAGQSWGQCNLSNINPMVRITDIQKTSA